jgi:hypothetical protein
MMLLKSCPRCHGDMMQEELPGEIEIVCLQCGHRTYPEALIQQPVAQLPIRKAA